MNETLIGSYRPANAQEAVEAVRAAPRVIPVGGGTKPRLTRVEAVKISTAGLLGIVEYEPSEFTFTALAGTPIREIAATLAERGQYLPFDPMLVDAGSTLGGTIASGLSGPGRFRFGGVRDFILWVKFIDGAGRLLRMGGKVVKNAAGFDVPKFLTGSLGRFGFIVEATFKVFPRPPEQLTLKLEVESREAGTRILTGAANSRWEPDALDFLPGDKCVLLRLAGPGVALAELGKEILARWPGRTLSPEEANSLWAGLREFGWSSSDEVLVKVPLSPALVPQFVEGMEKIGAKTHVSAGGNVAFVSLASEGVPVLEALLLAQKLCGLTLRGDGPLWPGGTVRPQILAAVKAALDCENRFPSLDD